MASIESLGLGSGVLTTELVENIINAEKEVAELRLDRQQELVEAKITAYGEIQSLMSTLQGAASSLASPSAVGATKATSSNESLLTVSSNSFAEPGSYNIDVLNTAKSHALATSSFAGFSDIVGTGELVISFGAITYDNDGNFVSQEVNPDQPNLSITIDDSNRTLSGIRDAINNADGGVTASIVNDGSGYRLLLNSTETGQDMGMRVAALDANGAYLSSGLAQLGFNEIQNGDGNIQQTSRGEDAQISLNGLTITRSTNAIDEVIKGVTLNLKNADIGNTVNVSIESDTEELVENMQAFVDAYNSLKVFTDELTSFNADIQQGGLLLGDSTLRSMLSQVRSMISQPIVGLSSNQFRSLTELGVNTNRNNDYLLEFEPSKFIDAVNKERSTIVGLLAKSGTTDDSLITYVNDSINTQAGTYDIEVTQLATQAIYTSGSLASLDFSSPVEINSSNKSFGINLNGVNATINLTEGSYSTGDALAKEIALQINSAESLSQYGYGVSVGYNSSDNNFSITSNKYGSDSQVYITSVSSSTANTLGFSTLSGGTYQGAELTTINAGAFLGRGASTSIGNTTVDDDLGIDFATSNASFSLSIDGLPATAITVSQSAAGSDLNNDGVFGDRQDTLQAIQTALDGSLLTGQVEARFDDQGYLIFETTAEGASKTIELTAVGNSSSDQLLGLNGTQGIQSNGKDSGLTINASVEFRVNVDGNVSNTLVSVPAGTYATGDALATEIQNQLNTTFANDPSYVGIVRGAETNTGERDISTGIDFEAENAGFTVNVSGVEKEIILNSNAAALLVLAPVADPLLGDGNSNLAVIQEGLDNAFGANTVTASLDGNGLKLTTNATGHEQYIEVTGDGRGARSSSFSDISGGIDFSTAGNEANFTLTVDGVAMAVTVDGNGTSGTNDSNSNLAVIQQALDEALENSGEFSSGDVVAKINDSNQLYFETLGKNGVRTAATFGASAAIDISNISGNGASTLGLVADNQSNGYRGFGFDNSRQFGYDLDALVTYQYDSEADLGSFDIQIGGEGTSISFSDLDPAATAIFGLQTASDYQPPIPVGKDVAGTINGIEATGDGQFLRATDGNEAATPGYYLGNEAADFTTPVVLDNTNNTFSINVDGVEASISLNQPATYVSGSALASALQTAINNAPEYQAENIAVKVEYTDDPTSIAHQKFGIISSTAGASSKVEITDVTTGAADIFGFARGIGDGALGKDTSGELNPSTGIRLKVLGGEIGVRGQVTYVSGFADQLNEILTNFLDNQDGVLTNKQTALQINLDEIASDREALEERISAQEARLKSQFLYNDKIISTLNTTLDYVQQQFEAMANSQKKN